MSLGPRLRELRVASRLTQRELASRIGIASPTVTNIETGARHPGLDVLNAWLKETGGRLELVREADPPLVINADERALLAALRALSVDRRSLALRTVSLFGRLDSSNIAVLDHLIGGLEKSYPSVAVETDQASARRAGR